MEIKTKHDIGDTLHVIHENRPHTFEVKNIIITEGGISYGRSLYPTFPENVCFKTRRELFDFILSQD